MGFNDAHARALIFDVETAALPDAARFLEEPTAPANYKDPLKIAEYIADAKLRAADRCSVDPDLARIVCIAWILDGRTEPEWVLARNDSEERAALTIFWDAARLPGGGLRRLVSFYGLSFDLPVLIRRSQYLNLEDVPLVIVDKYRTPHLDLHAKLTFNGVTKTHSLDFYAKRFALDVPHDEIDGADIGSLVRDGAWEQIRRHCELDVLKTAALARRIGFLAPITTSAEVA